MNKLQVNKKKVERQTSSIQFFLKMGRNRIHLLRFSHLYVVWDSDDGFDGCCFCGKSHQYCSSPHRCNRTSGPRPLYDTPTKPGRGTFPHRSGTYIVYTPFKNAKRWLGKILSNFFLLNDANVIGEHQETKMKMPNMCMYF